MRECGKDAGLPEQPAHYAAATAAKREKAPAVDLLARALANLL